MASMHHLQLLDPETSAVVSREKARQSHADRRRARSKSKDRFGAAVRSKSPLSGGRLSTPTPTHAPRSLSPSRAIGEMWRRVAGIALRWSRGHYRDNLRVTGREHMSDVDCFDGDGMRKGRFSEPQAQEKTKENEELDGMEEDLANIHPVVDGRLKDEGRK